MAVRKMDCTVYSIEKDNHVYRLVIEEDGQWVDWELMEQEVEVVEDGDPENGPSASLQHKGWKTLCYGMGGCSESEVESFVDRYLAEEQDYDH